MRSVPRAISKHRAKSVAWNENQVDFRDLGNLLQGQGHRMVNAAMNVETGALGFQMLPTQHHVGSSIGSSNI